jgi:HD-GYP domain-containing protein (c-di-GMP phosphodiesterase class II)
MHHDLAMKEIIRNSLTQFDPQVVRALLEAEERGLLAGPKAEAETRQTEVPVMAIRSP